MRGEDVGRRAKWRAIDAFLAALRLSEGGSKRLNENTKSDAPDIPHRIYIIIIPSSLWFSLVASESHDYTFSLVNSPPSLPRSPSTFVRRSPPAPPRRRTPAALDLPLFQPFPPRGPPRRSVD